jgi:uncharacterized membrane protein (DUF485 family)
LSADTDVITAMGIVFAFGVFVITWVVEAWHDYKEEKDRLDDD